LTNTCIVDEEKIYRCVAVNTSRSACTVEAAYHEITTFSTIRIVQSIVIGTAVAIRC
jgi:hypothetical protein